MPQNKEEIIWYAPEFEYEHKDVAWYWLTGIAAGILALISLWQRNILFAIFLVLAETMIIVWAKELPKTLQFKIDRDGIHLGRSQFYSYEDLQGFHILESHDKNELILKTKNRLHPFVKIIILENDSPLIKDFLKSRLSEVEYEESLADYFQKTTGF